MIHLSLLIMAFFFLLYIGAQICLAWGNFVDFIFDKIKSAWQTGKTSAIDP